MVIPTNIGTLINVFSFTKWVFYWFAMLSVIVMRWTRPNMERPFKVPLPIPIVMSIISAYLVIGPIVETPKPEYIYSMLFILAGLLLYVPFVFMRWRLPIMGKLDANTVCLKT
ncbi:PREDICTED: b(0,+)-type amino acid transporter 1-like [Priapulus caudatus]|uniref:B(0,+)-type amino acid transporter 1-like n=1 Tax=Priapulus caudatus TaxID=37621 RepID=A0ABM1F7D5_PRICU|nr:PREDICTED: b(0,+)-type amino acid transporter 1-like [Priapulus caudatus]